jgi:hypothetical protein
MTKSCMSNWGTSNVPRAGGNGPWDTVWISVVWFGAGDSPGSMRPFESMRCDANMVFTIVDLPSPVWPARRQPRARRCSRHGRTDDHDVELEAALQELVLDLARDRLEADVALRADLLDFGGHGGQGVCRVRAG